MSEIVIWPAYFERSLPRSAGRRVPIDAAVKVSKDLLERAIEKSGYSYEIVKKKYPRFWYEHDYAFLIDTNEPKTKVIRKISEFL